MAWIEEAIWGHRLERQPFSALMLDFLAWRKECFVRENYCCQHFLERMPNTLLTGHPTSQSALQQSPDGGDTGEFSG